MEEAASFVEGVMAATWAVEDVVVDLVRIDGSDPWPMLVSVPADIALVLEWADSSERSAGMLRAGTELIRRRYEL